MVKEINHQDLKKLINHYYDTKINAYGKLALFIWGRFEMENDTLHEVKATDNDKNETIRRLKDDSFFNSSHFKFNIIRQ